ncbi:MAG: RNA-binding protein [Bacteroidetes bacterium HGW-Bacteroidetes-10]|jgi:RNA recognition motif-containing protein|nr:MAG: RNA-binding protein [Bacteroidetes bacterium HGW-Bacteroidetes-10]
MNIFISNLSWAIKDADLRELFAEYGEISSAKVITDRETGKSRGFGFVEMPNEEEGKKAIEELDKAEYDGKVITVNVAKPREDRGGRPSGGGSRGGFGGGNRGGGYGRSNGGGFDRGNGGGFGGGNRRSY